MKKLRHLRFQKDFPWLFPWGLISLFILGVAAWLRLAHLGSIPTGLSWDEAFLGYVGRMVVTTGRDDHGQLLPVVFTSFGDYKAPLAVYLSGLSTRLLGVAVWSTRLPFALAGILTVPILAGIVWQRTKAWGWSLLAAWLLATLPWHIHFTRVAFESGLATFFYGLLLLGWQGARQERKKHTATALWWSCIVLGVLGSLYTYHSSKIVIPLSVLLIAGWEIFFRWPEWRQRWKEWLTAGAVTLVGLVPFLWGVLHGGLNRAEQTLFWHQLYTGETWWERLFLNILSHLNWSFLVQGQTDTLRHGTGVAGVLTGTLVLVLTLGSGWLIWHAFAQVSPRFSLLAWWRAKRPSVPQDGIWLWVSLLAIGFLPALLGFEVPHSNRALLAVLPLLVVTVELLRRIQATLTGNARQTLLASVILFGALESAFFWSDLIREYPMRSAAAWMEGNLEMSQWAGSAAENDTTIAITTEYGQPEIFFAFANTWPIERYRARDFGSVQFVDQSELTATTTERVVSAEPLDDPNLTLLQEITRQDGLTAYWIYVRE